MNAKQDHMDTQGVYYVLGDLIYNEAYDDNKTEISKHLEANVLYLGIGFLGNISTLVYDFSLQYGYVLFQRLSENLQGINFVPGKDGFLVSFGFGILI